MSVFKSNYPHSSDQPDLLPTPQRVRALSEYTGSGVVIAFIDAGFYPHPDIRDRILVHVDASTNHVVEQSADFETSDLSWHGQMTSVIACGDGSTSGGKYRGIASGAQLVLVKVSTPKGQIKERDILRGLRWLADTHRRFKVKVVNISVGGDRQNSDPNYALHRMVRKLTREGVTVVIAAGNRGTEMLLPPASAAEGITVGGINDNNSLDPGDWTLYRHNYGRSYDSSPKPEVLAPAEWIASPIMPGSSVAREARWLAPLLTTQGNSPLTEVLAKGHADLGLSQDLILNPDERLQKMLQQRIHAHKIIDAHHQHVDGTSVAAPIVASVAAQMLEANPGLTPAQIRAILTATAQPLPGIPIEKQGGGVVNAAQAVLAAIEFSWRKDKLLTYES
jgi:serine protease AprX